MDDSVLTNPVEMGKVVETAVYRHVAVSCSRKASSVGYYRGGRKDKEVDVVIEYANHRNVLIEVKYREKAPISDDDAICRICKEASAAIIVTKNMDDYGIYSTASGDELLRVPASAFLYLIGHAEKNGYPGIC
jgi:predicted AAA+ superfamily ATPase